MFKDWKEWNKWALVSAVLLMVAMFLPFWQVDYSYAETGEVYLTQEANIDGIDTINKIGEEETTHVDYADVDFADADDEPYGFASLDTWMMLFMAVSIFSLLAWAMFEDEYKFKGAWVVLGILPIIIGFFFFIYTWDAYLDVNDMTFFFEDGANLDLPGSTVSGNPSWGFFIMFGAIGLSIFAMKSDIKELADAYIYKRKRVKRFGRE